MNEEKDVIGDQPEARPYFRGEEIGRNKYIHVAVDEFRPSRLLLAIARRWQSVSL